MSDLFPAPPIDPPPESAAASDAKDHAAADLLQTDAALQTLEDTLDSALGDLAKRNRQVEDYLDFLKQERRRELHGANAGQMTIDDITPAPPPEDTAETTDPGDPTTNG